MNGLISDSTKVKTSLEPHEGIEREKEKWSDDEYKQNNNGNDCIRKMFLSKVWYAGIVVKHSGTSVAINIVGKSRVKDTLKILMYISKKNVENTFTSEELLLPVCRFAESFTRCSIGFLKNSKTLKSYECSFINK